MTMMRQEITQQEEVEKEWDTIGLMGKLKIRTGQQTVVVGLR